MSLETLEGKLITRAVFEEGSLYLHLGRDGVIFIVCPLIVDERPMLGMSVAELKEQTLQ